MPLTTSHAAYLAARGVTDPAVMEERGYESVCDGLKIPVCTLPDGASDYSETRLDQAGEDGRKFTRPAGARNRLNVNPLMLDRITGGGSTLFIVEGTTRADALAQRGVPAISIMGCWGWLDHTHALLAEWRDVPLRERKLIWVPDGDAFTNPNVNRATHEFIKAMTRRHAKVQLLELPPDQGLDDWLAAGHDLLDIGALIRTPDQLPELAQPKLTRTQMADKKGLPDTADEALAELWVLSDPSHPVRVAGHGVWYAYSGDCWHQDRTRDGLDARSSLAALLTTVAGMYVDAAETDAEKAVAQATYRDLRSAAKLNSVYARFQSLPRDRVTIQEDDFDQDTMLFNCRNGTVDLRTGVLRPHDPMDRLRGMSPTRYVADAEAPRWVQFLDEVFPGQQDVVDYLQLILGAALIGHPALPILPVFVGTGRNGKSTLIKALTRSLGRDYMGACDNSLLISSKFEGHLTKVMALKGKRLVHVSETEAGEKLAVAALKRYTGGDELSARGMREDQTTFMPTHTMILLTNNLPQADGQDEALWARLKLIRFSQSFLANPDIHIDQKLADEAEGILAWLVRGCVRFNSLSGPLVEPKSVWASSSEWRAGESTFRLFLSEQVVADPKGRVTTPDLREAYRRWCQTSGMDEETVEGRGMSNHMRSLGATPGHTKVSRHWDGVRLVTATDPEPTSVIDSVTDVSAGQKGTVTDMTVMTVLPYIEVLEESDPTPPSTTTTEREMTENRTFRHQTPSDLRKPGDATVTPEDEWDVWMK